MNRGNGIHAGGCAIVIVSAVAITAGLVATVILIVFWLAG